MDRILLNMLALIFAAVVLLAAIGSAILYFAWSWWGVTGLLVAGAVGLLGLSMALVIRGRR